MRRRAIARAAERERRRGARARGEPEAGAVVTVQRRERADMRVGDRALDAPRERAKATPRVPEKVREQGARWRGERTRRRGGRARDGDV